MSLRKEASSAFLHQQEPCSCEPAISRISAFKWRSVRATQGDCYALPRCRCIGLKIKTPPTKAFICSLGGDLYPAFLLLLLFGQSLLLRLHFFLSVLIFSAARGCAQRAGDPGEAERQRQTDLVVGEVGEPAGRHERPLSRVEGLRGGQPGRWRWSRQQNWLP